MLVASEARLRAAAALLAVTLSACGDDTGSRDGLVERMRDGGTVLLLRHAETDSAADMTADASDCSRQRNLDGGGRRQARDIGAAVRALRIPIGDVLASPFCRTRDTARIGFGRARSSRALLSTELAADGSAGSMRRLLRQRPPAGTNTVLVSHESAIESATGVSIEEGETLVIGPATRRPGFRVVARLMPRDWRELAER